MTLGSLLKRIGPKKLSKRLGVSESTLNKWISKGVSNRFKALVKDVVSRSERSIRAAATVKVNKTRKFRESFEVPEQAELDEDALLPTTLPGDTKEVKRLKRKAGLDRTIEAIDTPFNYGRTTWATLGQSVTEVSPEEITDRAVSEMLASGHDYCSVKFWFLRYIPFNPAYKGEMIAKQGTWVEQWSSTQAASTRLGISRYIEYAIETAKRGAETRVIWLEMVGIACFDRKHEA